MVIKVNVVKKVTHFGKQEIGYIHHAADYTKLSQVFKHGGVAMDFDIIFVNSTKLYMKHSDSLSVFYCGKKMRLEPVSSLVSRMLLSSGHCWNTITKTIVPNGFTIQGMFQLCYWWTRAEMTASMCFWTRLFVLLLIGLPVTAD